MPEVSTVVLGSAAEGSCPAQPAFRCTLKVGGTRATWVHVAGDVNPLTSPQLRDTLRGAELNARLIVLDMRDVTSIDSSGVGVILEASNDFEWGGARLWVVPGPVVDRTLTLAGVADQIATFELPMTEPAPELHLV
jgi:anti-anti-sigma factor